MRLILSVSLFTIRGFLNRLDRYNSIQSPAVYAYSKTESGYDFYLFKQRESYEQVSAFWGEKEPSKL